ncbi:hypothetical protein [Staphylococcus chromogenes]|uniref:hypothetical protein n=1 Tax=Staphylococcus chromogenes TaxID=46126 RepID=UPI000D1B2C7D|nr:hypothetical protein [Staphylococcus chromogenes]PTG19521.1 hypothetical protein BU637_09430 [Staphylococcus chromogenes]PTG62702.1 hypothetical protein BU674_10560 [Staphylococcus chromogenes]
MQFQSYLEQLQQQDQYRQLREVKTARKQRLYRDGQAWINFTSNDYLGLGQRSIKMDELERAIQKYGAHLGSSRLVSGHSTLYAEIEQDISEAYGFEGSFYWEAVMRRIWPFFICLKSRMSSFFLMH